MYYASDEYTCCKESSIIVYHRGVTLAHCYQGTRKTWELADARGYFDCNSAYMIIGVDLCAPTP